LEGVNMRTKEPTEAELRHRRWARGYLREITPTPGCPSEPCGKCNDRVFYRIAHSSPWKCRACQPVDARRRVLWFVAPPTTPTHAPAPSAGSRS
jgi:hypothetical protein